ncbi:MAG: hypothetical protein VZR56_07915 [Treponema sp.]|nr:hypothetical protein [Treponema sp.]
MMKQRIIKVIGLIFAVLIFSVIVLFAHEIPALKKICFYDYDFTDKNSITKDFETLGFTHVEDEKSMRRKMLFDDIYIYPDEIENYIRVSFDKEYIKKCFEIILLWHYSHKIKEGDLPGVVYPLYEILCYKYKDRSFDLCNSPEGGLLFIEFNQERSQKTD